ncbi:hypothetical protein Esti_002957 [Eimeria stiedai]
MATFASACARSAVSTLTRRVIVANREMPHIRSFTAARNLQSTPLDRELLRAARSFRNVNFRDYFIRRTKEKIRELHSNPELNEQKMEAVLQKELRDLRRQALIANLYHCPTVAIYNVCVQQREALSRSILEGLDYFEEGSGIEHIDTKNNPRKRCSLAEVEKRESLHANLHA